MSYIPPTKESLKNRLNAYFDSAGFTKSLDTGTPENALLNILTDNLFSIYRELETSYASALPLNATATTLDSWADFFGIGRTLALTARDANTNNVHFFVRDKELTGDIVIPADTIISDGDLKTYKTLTEVSLPSIAPNIVFVGVEALSPGAASNVEAGELTSHTLTEEYIEVSNRFAITSGADAETDTAIQLSLQSLFGKRIGTNMESILEKVSSLPGVSEASIFNADRGTGTFSVFIDSTSPIVTDSLLSQAQGLLNAEKALGTVGYVVRPTYKGVSLKIELMSRDGSDISETIDKEVTPSIINTINNVSRGASLNPAELVRLVLNHENVLDADIAEFSIGTYDISNNKLNNVEIKAGGKQNLSSFEKWFGSSDLISYCMIENG